MKSTLALLLIMVPFFALSQAFRGVLIYEFDSNKEEEEGLVFKRNTDGKTLVKAMTYCYIDSSRLFTVDKDRTGRVIYNQIQTGEIAYLGGGNDSIPYHQLNPLGEPSLKFDRKTKEEKYILGVKCTKYIYWLGEDTKINAWIPDGFVYFKQASLGKFFQHFIFPHGLVFEKELIYEDVINHFKLVKIEMLDDWKGQFSEAILNSEKR